MAVKKVISDTNLGSYLDYNNIEVGKVNPLLPAINLTPIAFTPTPTGNATNRNEFVITPTGDKYFIDYAGDGMLIEKFIGTVFYSGANITNATATMVAIPALSFNVVPGWYRVKFYPFYNAATTATGAGFNLGSGTAVRTNQTLKAEIHTTTTAMQIFDYSSLAQNYTNTASPRTTDNRAYIEAHFQVTTAGTIIPMFRSENTRLITLRAGSYLTYEKIG